MNAFVELIKKIGIFMIAAQAVIHFAPGQKYEKYIKLIVGIMILLQFLTPVYRMLSKTALEESDWSKLISDALEEDAAGETAGSEFIADTVINQLEEEIKFRLNQELNGENYTITGVKVSMRTSEAQEGNGITQYELERVRVVVRRTYAGGGGSDAIGSGAGTDYINRTNRIDGTNGMSETDEINGPDGINGTEETDKTEGIHKIDKIQIQEINVALDDIEIQNGEEEREKEKDKGSASVDRNVEKEAEFRERFCSILGMEEKHMEVSVYGAVDESDG